MLKRILPLLLLTACSAPQQAESETPLFDAAAARPAVERILAAGLSSEGAFEALGRLLEAAPKRLSGSAGYDRAVEWAQAEMLRAGLTNVHVEPCTVPHWERGEIERLGIVLEPGGEITTPLALTALGGSVATPPGGVEAEVLRVTSRAELSALGERGRGRIVFFDEPMDATLADPFEAYGGAVWQRSRGASEAAKLEAVAVLVRSMTLRRDDFPHTGAMRYESGVARIPAAAISTLAAETLAEQLALGQPVRVRLELDCQTLPDAPAANVVGELVGRELPGEILVVGGHLDAWDTGSGAHDDGAGCVESIEAARLLALTGLIPRRTIRVVLYANEENGLAGARAYALQHADELAQHVLAMESDRGGFAPRGFDSNADQEGLALLSAMAELLEPIGAARVTVGGGGADISTLAPAGVPLVGLVPEAARYFDVHHAGRDTLEAVSPRELQLGAAAMASLLYLVAEMPQRFPRNPLPDAPAD